MVLRLSELRVLWKVHTLAGHGAGVASVAFAADGKRVISGSCDKLVKIWDVEPGAEVMSFL